MPARRTVLVVDRENAATAALIAFLRAHCLKVLWARDGEGASHALDEARIDAVVAPFRSPGIDGVSVCRHARKRHPEAYVVLSVAASAAAEARAAGADDLLPRPVDRVRLLATLERGLAQRRLAERRAELGRIAERFSAAPFTGRSRAIGRVVEQVRHLASTHAAVLIEGEPGTGKSLAAQAIHRNSPRRGRPFVWIDCGAIVEPLLETSLFGVEPPDPSREGWQGRPGLLELADGGTLLLNEVDELPAGVQMRLLRVLQDRAFERLGGQETLKVDVRLIASTTRDLAALARRGGFREDLFQRLGTVRIVMPPLRDRREDIPPLVERFLAESKRGRGIKGVTRGVLDRLMEHSWPGNVHELRDTIAGMVMVARRGRPLDLADLPEALRLPQNESGHLEVSVGMTVDETERQLIAATLAHTGNDKPRAAALLGIGLRTLYRKLKEYEIG